MPKLLEEIEKIIQGDSPEYFLPLFFQYLPQTISEEERHELFSYLHLLSPETRGKIIQQYGWNPRLLRVDTLLPYLVDRKNTTRGTVIDLLMKKSVLPLFLSWDTIDIPQKKMTEKFLFYQYYRETVIFCEKLTHLYSEVKDDAQSVHYYLEALAHFREVEEFFLPHLKKIWGSTELERYLNAKTQLEDQHFPQQLLLALTYDCNLSCPYCYAKDKVSRPMSPEVYKKVLEWMKKNNYRRISFTGGEPTLHPCFHQFLKEAKRNDFEIFFSSNGLFEETTRFLMNDIGVSSLGLHLTRKNLYSPIQLKRLLGNIGYFANTAIDLYLRINIDTIDEDFLDFAFEVCVNHGIKSINFALCFPNTRQNNSYIPLDDMELYKQHLISFFRRCSALNVTARLAKPIPFCMFSEDELRDILAQHELHRACAIFKNDFTNVNVVNPDGSVSGCIALPDTSRSLFSFNDVQELSAHVRDNTHTLFQHKIKKECGECALYYTKKCRGACLAYHAIIP